MKNIMISSILAATACFAMIGQASAAPATHFTKHQVTHAQQHKTPKKVMIKNHKHTPEVAYVKKHR